MPSKNVTASGFGPNASAIMRSLAPATGHAIPAAGIANGTAYAGGLKAVPITGPITVTRSGSGKSTTVNAFDGQFSITGPPGRYVLTGHAGSAQCPPVSVTIISGETVTAPPIGCNGD